MLEIESKINEDHQQEYETRKLYFQCSCSSIEGKIHLEYAICSFNGTRQEFDNLINEAIKMDKDFTYEIKKIWDNEMEYLLDRNKGLTEAQAKANRVNEFDTKRHDQLQRIEEYRYLKSGY